MNAIIKNADIVFSEPYGRQGMNFMVELQLKGSSTSANVRVNPLRLPDLLCELGLKSFNELAGTYVQVDGMGLCETVRGIRNILSDREWFTVDNDLYVGCEFMDLIKDEYKEALL